MKIHNKIWNLLPLLTGLVLFAACEQDAQVTPATVTQETNDQASNNQAISNQQTLTMSNELPPSIRAQNDKQFTIGNKRYLYDISEHNIDDLKSLLKRAEEITKAGGNNLDNLEIVMILHGPDIGWFTLENYNDNKELVDLAKKLDAFDIIDLKVCETTMQSMSIDRNQLPSFIESIPYAPDELSRLTREGYTHF